MTARKELMNEAYDGAVVAADVVSLSSAEVLSEIVVDVSESSGVRAERLCGRERQRGSFFSPPLAFPLAHLTNATHLRKNLCGGERDVLAVSMIGKKVVGEGLRWSNTNNKLLQLATQHCCIASWKALLAVLPCTHLKNCHATKFIVASWKKLLKKVNASSTWCNMLLQLATTKFCCVTMFEVGGNTCNNAFQLATQQCCVQVEEKCCPYNYRALTYTWLVKRNC